MNDEPNNDAENADLVDRAVASRLSRLKSTPLDTAAFDAKLKAALPESSRPTARPTIWRAFTPVRALAAVVLVGLIAFLSFALLGPSPAMATPQRLAAIYEDSVGGNARTTIVTSIEEARSALRRKWPDSPALPDVSDKDLMHCCVHEIGRKQMACLTFEVDRQPVTLAFASSRDIRSPQGELRTIDGRAYRVGSSGGVNMVMSESNGTWMCLMGRLPLERLAELSDTIRN